MTKMGLWGLLIFGCVAVSLYQLDPHQFASAWNSLRAVTPWEAAALVSLNVCIVFVLALRGFMVLRGLGSDVGWLRWLQIRQLGFLISVTTPGPQLGGEPAQVLALEQCGVDPARGLTVTLADKILDLVLNTSITLVLVGLVGYSGLLQSSSDAVHALPLVLALVAGLAGAAGLMMALKRGLLNRWEFGKRLHCELKGFAALSAGTWAAAGLASLVGIGLMGLEWWFIWSLVHPNVGWVLVVSTWIAGRVALWGPVPGAIGVLEASVIGATLSLGGGLVDGVAVCALTRARDLGLLVSSAAMSLREWLSWRR